MSPEDLLSIPPAEWATDSAICLGWHDGPTDVVVRLARPEVVLHAELVAERPTEDDLDDRIFRATIVPTSAFQRLTDALAPIGPARRPVWVPLWQFPTQDARLRAEEAADACSGGEPVVLIRSDDMKRFHGVWPIEAGAGETGNRLFEKLGL
jgi:hypothetical protein